MFTRALLLLVSVLSLAACGGAPAPTPASAAQAPPASPGLLPAQPDVIIHLIDTLRKDHLGCYGYPLETSPSLDAFALEAVRFRNLIPMSSWTRPSVISLLTGTMDYTHHALSPEDRPRPGLPSLAQALEAAGWSTRAIIANPAVGGDLGPGPAFQRHDDVWEGRQPVGIAADLAAVGLALEAIHAAGPAPLFLYLHTMAPHREYDVGPEYVEKFMPERFVGTREQVRIMKDLAHYDAEIRFSDDQFARVIAALKAAGRYDNALIVVLSDHGEQFMEHGEMAHGMSLHWHELGVPLIMKLPRGLHAGAEPRPLVQMAEIAPTILEILGLARPEGMDGRSVLPFIALEGQLAPKPAFARLRIGQRDLYMAQDPDVKYLYDAARGESTWYDLYNDPLELRPLRQPPEGGQTLQQAAEAFAARPVPAKGGGSAPLTPGQAEDLKALGYL